MLVRKVLKWLAWTFLVLVLAVIAINFYDPPLSETAKTMSQAPANPYPPEQNLYVALRGFSAPAGESVVATGSKRIAEDNRIADLYVADPSPAVQQDHARGYEQGTFRGALSYCKSVTASCWKDAEKHAAEIQRTVDDNSELMRRYLDLHRLPVYFETAAPSVLVRFVYVPAEVRNLFLARTALQAKRGLDSQRAMALSDLHSDIRLWRTMLKGEGVLVSKMLAISSLQGDLLLLGEMLADRSVDWTPHAAEIESMLGAMQGPDWSVGGMAGPEFRFVRATLAPLQQGTWRPDEDDESAVMTWLRRANARVSMHFLKLNATLNTSADMWSRLGRLADTDSAVYPMARASYEEWVGSRSSIDPSWIYNPIGKVLTGVAMPSYQGYSDRARDIEALHRMVRLTHEIRKAQVPGEGIPAFMAAHPEWSTHPASAVSFEWDAQAQALSVPRIADTTNPQRRYDIPFVKAP